MHPVHLGRVPLTEKGPCSLPLRFERVFQEGFFNQFSLVFRYIFEPVVGPINIVELGTTHGEHGAALEHLNLDTQLEHVRCRCHDDIRLTRLGQHLFHQQGGVGLHTGLIDGTGEDVGRPHGKGGRG